MHVNDSSVPYGSFASIPRGLNSHLMAGLGLIAEISVFVAFYFAM